MKEPAHRLEEGRAVRELPPTSAVARPAGARLARLVRVARGASVVRFARVLFVAWLVACLVPGAARAQTVTGIVLDARTESPLSGVLVSLLDPDDRRAAATLTDETGSFSLEPGRFGRFRIRAERIGLQTLTSGAFELFTTVPREERILMADRAIEIAGLVVDSRIEQCRLDPGNAMRIQRWWQEVRTALDVSSVVQSEGLAHFQVERYEREWDEDLDRVLSQVRHAEVGLSSRPFVSAEAAFLAEGGFIQGSLEGEREYYAPDADVLLSDIFLSRHCFSVTSHDDDDLLGLSFEPTRDDVPDIHGTLWVDTTTAELQSLDFRYSETDDEPDSESGGFVAFEYLSSGAWIVREWYIRMPRLARDAWSSRIELVGYVDVGGTASPLEATTRAPAEGGAVGAVRGVVYDSVGDRRLQGATVSVFGTALSAITDARGEFVLPVVPAGEQRLTFSHPDPRAWGLGAPLVSVDVKPRLTSDVTLAVPGFRRVAGVVCQGGGLRAEAVLVVEIQSSDGVAMEDVPLVLSWPGGGSDEPAPPVRREGRTGPGGRFVSCTIPSEKPVSVDLRIEGRLIRGFDVTMPFEAVVYRRVQVPVTG